MHGRANTKSVRGVDRHGPWAAALDLGVSWSSRRFFCHEIGEFLRTFWIVPQFVTLKPTEIGREHMTAISSQNAGPEGLMQLRQTLESTYGLLMDNAQLREALGYRTQSAFDRAMKH